LSLGLAFTLWVSRASSPTATYVAVEYRWAENQPDRLPALVADLVRRRVEVIVAGGTPAALAAKAATATIPIVFSTGGDPVALGLVASLNRPGANVTGSAVLEAELATKRLQLVHDLIPNAALFGVLADPAFPATPSTIGALQTAVHTGRANDFCVCQNR
jgi:putative ABC transport system substrate-binding protein